MGEIANAKIKYEGPFNVKSLYEFIIDFLDSNGFSFKEKKLKYSDKGEKIGIETEIEFEKEYEKDIKVSGKIELKIENMEDIIVKTKDSQQKLQKGKVEVKIKAEYKDEYGKDIEGQLNKILLEIYKNTLAKKHFKDLEKKAKEEMKDLIVGIKKQLNLHKYLVIE